MAGTGRLGDYAHAAGIPGIAPGSPPGFVPPPPIYIMDGSKITRLLGLHYLPRAETTVDSIRSYYERFPSVDPSNK